MIFPEGAVNELTEFIIYNYSANDIPPAPSGFKEGITNFSIEGISNLAKEITIIVQYSEDDFTEMSGGPENLFLAYLDMETNNWFIVPTTVNEAERTLTAVTDHLSTWIVLDKIPFNVNWLIVTYAAAGFVLLMILLLLLRSRQRRAFRYQSQQYRRLPVRYRRR